MPLYETANHLPARIPNWSANDNSCGMSYSWIFRLFSLFGISRISWFKADSVLEYTFKYLSGEILRWLCLFVSIRFTSSTECISEEYWRRRESSNSTSSDSSSSLSGLETKKDAKKGMRTLKLIELASTK